MEVVRAHPSVALNVTVDDIQITPVDSSDNVVADLVDVAGDMLDVVDRDLYCVAKRGKAATVPRTVRLLGACEQPSED